MCHLECCFQDQNNLYFVLDFYPNGDMRKIIDLRLKGTEYIQFVKFLTAELVLGLEILHNKNICHRDMKPDNIMFDKNFHAKIGDFGESKKFENLNRQMI